MEQISGTIQFVSSAPRTVTEGVGELSPHLWWVFHIPSCPAPHHCFHRHPIYTPWNSAPRMVTEQESSHHICGMGAGKNACCECAPCHCCLLVLTLYAHQEPWCTQYGKQVRAMPHIVFTGPVLSSFLPLKWATMDCNWSRTNPDIEGTEMDHLQWQSKLLHSHHMYSNYHPLITKYNHLR